MHNCPYGRVTPRTNAEFWQTKRLSNVERDKRNMAALKNEGWKVLTVWECWVETKLLVVLHMQRILVVLFQDYYL